MPSQFPGLTKDLALLTSETLDIAADSGKKHFFVHSDVLAGHSEQLRAMTEAPEKGIDLSGWDGDTVARFVQFLYVGDYQVPDTVPEEEGAEVEGEEVEEEGVGKRDGMDTPDTVQSQADKEKLGTRRTNILLVHAKVYTLAQEKDVVALQTMALERLGAALAEIDKHIPKKTSRVTLNVVELLEYVYSRKAKRDTMRDLVSKFAAGNVEELMGSRGMALLLVKGGDFAVEMMGMVLGRLLDMERDVESRVSALESGNTEKVQQLEAKVLQFEGLRTADEAKIQGLDGKVRRIFQNWGWPYE